MTARKSAASKPETETKPVTDEANTQPETKTVEDTSDPKVQPDGSSEEVKERKPSTTKKTAASKAKERTERYEVTHKGKAVTVEHNVDTGETKVVS